MRIYVKEEHVLSAEQVDVFIACKEKNGFAIVDVAEFPVAGNDKKIVIIEKWNLK